MEHQESHEKILIAIALVLCACVIGYNAFFVPEITIPTVISTDSASKIDSQDQEDDENEIRIVNINTASAEELTKNLDGIGEVTANSIINYRETYGNFKTIEEIRNIRGIGKSTFDKIKDNICV